MSLNLLYSLREGIIGLRRARVATFVTISTIAVTLALFGIFLVLTVNVQRIVGLFRERMALEVFIDNSLNSEQIKKLGERLSSLSSVRKVTFVSKDEALRKFKKEFGEDPLTFLGENPLPSSFEIKVQQVAQTPQGVERLAKRIENIKGVEEVVYHGKLFRVVDRYSRIIIFADIFLSIIVLLAAILLVANTLRLTILSQRNTIQIMQLVGATKSFIRRPYIIQGVLQGGIGGAVGSIVVWILVRVVALRFPHLLEASFFLVSSPFVLGMVLGFLGSGIGVKRFLQT